MLSNLNLAIKVKNFRARLRRASFTFLFLVLIPYGLFVAPHRDQILANKTVKNISQPKYGLNLKFLSMHAYFSVIILDSRFFTLSSSFSRTVI